MHPLIERLVGEAPVVTDGAWGTELQARGLSLHGVADAWNLSHADQVEQVARRYVRAGSRVLLTNTFGANRVALGAKGLADRVVELNRAGVEISRRAAAGKAFVFGSIGPSGKRLSAGQVSEAELRGAFAEQAQALAAAGADALVVETMCELGEAEVAASAAKATGLPVVVSMVFSQDQVRTLSGETPEQVAEALDAAGADVVGSNCGYGIAEFVGVCRRLRAATHHPVWIKPSAGVPEIVADKLVYRTTAEDFAAHEPALVDAGASFIGGCCGTTPEFIRALARRIKG